LRPMSAAISPRRRSTSTSRTAATAPWNTTTPRARSAISGGALDEVTAGGGSTSASRSASAPARRRASRTDSGSGFQPAAAPKLLTRLDVKAELVEDLGVEEMVVNPNTSAMGKSLEEVGLLEVSAARVLAVRRRDGTLHTNPDGKLRLEEGDLVIALGTEDQLFASATLLK